jgi:ferredoxin
MDTPYRYRLLRKGLHVASRAAGELLDRAVQRQKPRDPAPEIPRSSASSTSGIQVAFSGRCSGSGVVAKGSTLLEAGEALGLDLDHFCGGNCSCGTCRLEVVSGMRNLSRMDPMERAVLGIAADDGSRLACQARAFGPVDVRVPEF